MPRPLRKIQPESTYHCFSRCQGLNQLLENKIAKKCFIKAIEMCQRKYMFELNAVEIVSNHFHLMIRTLLGKESISLIMQYIKARTAEMYNKETGRVGPFWNERFGCTIIEEADNPIGYSLHAFWYIAMNPVKKRESCDPRENYIGFINCYLTEDYELPHPIKITLHYSFYSLGENFSECARKFLFYEDAYRKRLAVYF
ncbi:MAG: transposase [Spirochaetes bacterium]|nr:transposase [Spirochaetota bacterium]